MDLSFPLDCLPRFEWDKGGLKFGASRPGGRVHSGIDLIAPAGTVVRAMAPGTVVSVYHEFCCTPSGRSCGAGVQIIHRVPPIVGTMLYGEIDPEVGAYHEVKAGERLGTVKKIFAGQTNPMLHLEYYPKLLEDVEVFTSKRKPGTFNRAKTPADASELVWDFITLLQSMATCKAPSRVKKR